jgi:DNA-binding transcriptional ArsR family regulator
MKKSRVGNSPELCSPKAHVRDIPLLGSEEARSLMALFKVLANDTRLRLLHSLVRQEQMSVTELSQAVSMKPQAVSNQLQKLVDQGILGARRNGNNVHYRIVDPCVESLLNQGWCLMEDSLRRRKS